MLGNAPFGSAVISCQYNIKQRERLQKTDVGEAKSVDNKKKDQGQTSFPKPPAQTRMFNH